MPKTRAKTAPTPRTSSIGKRRAAALDRGDEAYIRRRTEIVTAAARVFHDNGYQDSTLSDVAAAAGVGRATLYFYIGSKQEVIDEIVMGILTANLALAEEISASSDLGSVKLRKVVTRLMSNLAGDFPLLGAFVREERPHASRSSASWAAGLRSVNHRLESTFRRIVQHGVEDGTLRGDVDAELMAVGMTDMIWLAHRQLSARSNPSDVVAMSEGFAGILLDGLALRRSNAIPRARAAVPHPDVVRLLERFAKADIPTYDSLDVPQARTQLGGVVRLQSRAVALATVIDVIIDGAAEPLLARVYRPMSDGPLPVVVYLHGGGWVLGDLDVADRPCRALAASTPCVVVSVDYRLAPETKFPGALEDCVQAVRWVADRAATWGGSDRLVLVGDSAGGNLTAATSTILRDEGGPALAAQVLIYPTLAPPSTTDFASYRTFADGPLMTRRELEWFWAQYLRGQQDATDPSAAPLHAKDLAGLPPTTIFVAQLDPLHDEGVEYATKLMMAGTPVHLVDVEGAAHGFWWMDKAMSQAAELTAAVARVVRGTTRDGDR